ncbi:uncharacterized protein FIBRA_05510 [Fibroporia radiculosa]|uniref:MARVEL domain-containing protein n=1 Tax=Fibroporia radiculosa TaxID=599839 RepID=J4GR63_9APHY|nr:uncharacterized protein FIBRA_05510 [Fibroporia radiculosa]CCM03380.1 predicted protein [Fibroporia radiculosa]
MSWLYISRLAIFAIVALFSLIVLGVAGNISSTLSSSDSAILTYVGLGIATSVLTLLSIPAMLVVDLLMTGFFTSMILVELAWLSFLWILWLATGALVASDIAPYTSCNFFYKIEVKICQESQAVEAFAFLNWILLLVYTVVLLVFTIISAQRGESIWTSSVKSSMGGRTVGTSSRYPMSTNTGDVPPVSQAQRPQTEV